MNTKRLPTIIIWLTLLVSTHGLVSQTHLKEYVKIRNAANGVPFTKKTDSLIQICREENKIEQLVKIAHDYSIELLYQGRPGQGIFYATMEKQALREAGLIDTAYTKALYVLGRNYAANADFDNAIKNYEELIALNIVPGVVAQAHAEIGNCYLDKGDFHKAIRYYEKALVQLEEHEVYRSLINQSINAAVPYRVLGDDHSLDRRIAILLKADSLANHHNVSERNKRNLKEALAIQYKSGKYYDFDKAKSYYLLNLDTALAHNDSTNISITYNNLAELYNLESKDSALYYNSMGMRYVQDIDVEASLYETRARYFTQRHQYDQALANVNSAIRLYLSGDLPTAERISDYRLESIDYKYRAATFLKLRSDCLIQLYLKHENPALLQSAINTVRSNVALIDIMRWSSEEDNTHLFWQKEASAIYMQGVYMAHLQQDTRQMFHYMEKNKAMLLATAVAKNQSHSKLPYDLAQRENLLKKNVLKQDKAGDEAAVFDAKSEYEHFMDSLKPLFPNYFEAHRTVTPVSMSEVQAELDPNDLLVSYIWNDFNEESDEIFGLAISDSNSIPFKVEDSEVLTRLIEEYSRLLQRPLNTQGIRSAFVNVSHQLYQQLFPTEELRNMIAGKQLKIVGDGLLQMMPFESLITDTVSQTYLLHEADIGYLYSHSFQFYNESADRFANKPFLAYAPVKFAETGLNDLKNSEGEVRAINQLVRGDVRMNELASKSVFLEESGAYQALHLATHAQANGEPWIAFADEKLELNDLYTHRINADLVVLSACNTLTGQIASGEGVISLSRGFFHSGAKSVVASLWSVNDKATSEIMTTFYENLKAGQNKLEAINNAKRQYLNNHSLSELSPYYWSSFVLLGDDGFLEFEATPNYLKWLFPALLLLLFAGFRKKVRKAG